MIRHIGSHGRNKVSGGGDSVTFVVYVNHPTSKALVHSVDCHVFQGRKRESTPNGYWKVGFPDRDSALRYARSTRKKRVDSALCCI